MSDLSLIIIMGACGSGKTTLGQALAKKLNWQFQDADNYHSDKNKALMKTGIGLQDEDRGPWLENLAKMIIHWQDSEQSTVLACSALKKSYRAILIEHLRIEARSKVRLIYLKASFALLQKRLADREHEYMNPDLLASQLAILEEPTDAIILDAEEPLTSLLDKIIALIDD